MDSTEIGQWLLQEARVSFRYWHSSASCRKHMNKPFFDRNQCQGILEEYTGDEEKRLA
jgi:hypothetical protein